MSKTVDSRIVEMQFDNKDFEKNVSTSLNTLDNLNKQLKDLEGANGLEELGRAAKNVNMSALNDEVNKTGKSFSALQEVAIGCFREIGSKITGFGMQLASDVLAPLNSVIKAFNELATLPLTSINSGFDKFKEKTGSVGTLISQGYDMDLVTEQLEKLNFFTDETSYNFTDMVNEIGKFTAAGQELDDSVEAMMGIANWAALSGQNATKASQAMYQLSQAMGKGALKLDDYKSIQNANMDTQEFRKNAIEAAKAIGTIKEEANGMFTVLKTNKTFTFQEMFTSDALTKGAWLSSDVMMSVFKKYSSAVDLIYEKVNDGTYETASEAIAAMGDSLDAFGLKAFKAAQEARSWSDVVDSLKDAASTSWMNIFEQIFGNYEEAKDLFTDMANNFYDMLVTPIQEFGEIFEEWNMLGGRDIFWDSFWEMLDGIGRLLQPIKDAFHEIFGEFDPEALGDKLYILTLRFKDWAKQLGWSEKTAENLKNVCKGLFAIIKSGINSLKALWQIAQPFVRIFKSILSFGLDFAGALGEIISGITGVTSSGGALLDLASNIEAIFVGLGEPIETFKKNLIDIFDGHWLGADSGLLNFANTLFEILKSLVALVIDSVSVITGIDLSGFEDNVIGAMNHVRDEIRIRIAEIKEVFENIFSNLKINMDGIRENIRLFFMDSNYRSEIFEIGKNCILGLIEGMKSAAANILPKCVIDIAKSVIQWFKDTFMVRSPSLVFAWIGEMLMAGFEQGIRVGIAAYVTPVLKELVDIILGFLNERGISESVKNLAKTLISTVSDIFKTISHTLISKNENGEYIGVNILLGIGRGIVAGVDKLLPAIIEICRRIVKGFTDFFLISSPSKLMAALVGTMIVAGIAVGIEEAIPLLNPPFEALKTFFTGMEKFFKPLSEIIVTILDSLSIAIKAIVKPITDVSNAILQSGLGDRLAAYLKDLQIDTIIKEAKKILILIGIALTIRTLFKLVDSAISLGEKAVNVVGGIVSPLKSLAEGIGDLAETMKKDIKVRMVRTLLRDLGITLAAIVASIYVLGKMPPDTFERGAKYVAIIGGCMAAIVATLLGIAAWAPKGVMALEALNHFGLIFVGIGVSIFLIASAIKKIGKVDFTEMNQAKAVLIGIGSFFILYTGLMVTLSAVFGNEAVNSVWKIVVGCAASVYILGMALAKIARIPVEDFDRAYIAVMSMELIAMAFVAITVLFSKMDKGMASLKFAGLASAIVAVGICVNMLVNAMRHIGVLLEDGKKFAGGIAVIAGILVALAVLFRQAGKMPRAWKSLMAMAALFTAMGLVVKIVGEMELDDIMKGVGTLVAMEILIIALTEITARVNKKLGGEAVADVAKTLVAAAASMAILAFVVRSFAGIPISDLWSGIAVIGALTVCMSILIGVAGWANGKSGKLGTSVSGSWKKKSFSSVKEKSNGPAFGQLIAIALALGGLAYAVVQLGKVPDGDLLKGTAVILVLTLVMERLMTLMSKISSSPNFKIGNIISLTAAIGVIAGALIVLTYFADDWQSMAASAVGLATVLVGIGVALAILDSVGKKAEGAGKASLMLLSMCLTIAAIGGAIWLISQYDWQSIQQAWMGLTACLGVVMTVCMILGSFKQYSLIGAGVIAILAIDMLMFGASLLEAAYALQIAVESMSPANAEQIVEFFNTLADNLADVATKIAEGLTNAVNALTAAVPELEKALEAFISAIAAAFDLLVIKIDEKITPVALEFQKLVHTIKEIITSEFAINSPSGWFAEIGYWMLQGLAMGILANIFAPVAAVVTAGKAIIEAFCNIVGVHSMSTVFFAISKFCMIGSAAGFIANLFLPQNAAEQAGQATTNGFLSGVSGLLNGEIAKQISEQLGIDIAEGISFSDLFKNFDLSNLDIGSIDFSSMSDMDLTEFIKQLKEAGGNAEALDGILDNIQNKDNNIEFKATLDTKGLEDATKKVMSGAYGNGLPRWKKLYEEYLKTFNGDVSKAVQAVVDIQNNVNKTLGNKTVHNLDEMSKRLGVTAGEIKKTSEEAAKATKEASSEQKSVKYGSDDYYKETSKHGKTINNQLNKDVVRYGSDKYYEQANGLSINTLKTEREITEEKRKQVEEEYNQLKANGEIVSANERNLAMARLKAAEEKLASDSITESKKAQLNAEREQYRAVVDTYTKQQDMRNVINTATDAQKEQTKAVEDTKRAVEETAKAAKPVVYGSDEYYRQAKGGSINRMATREEYPVEAQATITKVDPPDNTPVKEAVENAGPVQADTKVEVSAKIDVVDVDTSEIEKEVVKAVEVESNKIKAVVEIKPKVDVVEANRSIDDFKKKTEDLSKTIPTAFTGVSTEISKFMGNVASTIKKESPKIETNYKDAFVNAASKAATAMNSSTIMQKFVNAGIQAANGLIKGMKSKQSDVANAGKALGVTASNATKKALKEKSPSKVMEQIGIYAGEGQERGMLSTIGRIYNAGTQMGEAAIEGLSTNLASIQYALDNADFDYSPSIVPVIDTSKIQPGLQSINNLIGQDRINGITANMNLSTQYNESKMKAMQDQLNNMSGAINDLSNAVLNQPVPEVTANVNLLGDADGVFKVVQTANNRYTKMHGRSAFA